MYAIRSYYGCCFSDSSVCCLSHGHPPSPRNFAMMSVSPVMNSPARSNGAEFTAAHRAMIVLSRTCITCLLITSSGIVAVNCQFELLLSVESHPGLRDGIVPRSGAGQPACYIPRVCGYSRCNDSLPHFFGRRQSQVLGRRHIAEQGGSVAGRITSYNVCYTKLLRISTRNS